MSMKIHQKRRDRRKAKASGWSRVPSGKVGHHASVSPFSTCKPHPNWQPKHVEPDEEIELLKVPFADLIKGIVL